MAPKKILAFIIIGAGIILGAYFLYPTKTNKNSAPPLATATPTQTPISKPTAIPVRASTLSDTAIESQSRVEMIMAMKETPDEAQVRELVTFILTQNPYESDQGGAPDPHSFEAYQFQKEAALRVFALRTLSEKLTVESFANVVATIESQASDEAIKRVAQQALAFKRAGRNYFEEMKKAIQAAPLPEHKRR